MKTLDELGVRPAPWKCEDGGLSSFLVYDNLPRNERHCICGGSRNDIACGQLIAAAPELYKALTVLVSFAQNPMASDSDMATALKMARKAIAKVGGKE